jgi:hypothetical protein
LKAYRETGRYRQLIEKHEDKQLKKAADRETGK